MTHTEKLGILYIIATPIGNPRDITLRALDLLKQVDAIICEEVRQGSRLLRQLGVENELLTLNEHNEVEEAKYIVLRLSQGESMAIISDAGTPVFADPGRHLLDLCFQAGISISPVPGPSSLMAALSLSNFPIDRFIFAGFPPVKSEHRERFLARYKSESVPVILMDTPYRLTKLLTEVQSVFGKNQDILLACDLTLKQETIYRGHIADILPKVTGQKREFVLILNLNKLQRKP
ncbi:MAG: 16S rRNA (cytidine(1402)-2'-O)-methyltransferase [Anaerolineaceae bacterium]